MKNIAPTILNKLLWLILVTFLLTCCHSKSSDNSKSEEDRNANNQVVQKKQTQQPQKAKWITLTDDNLEQVLTDYGKENKETLVKMITPKGTMIIKLYENTPLHRANFIRLIKNNFYKNTEFYRVRNNFMIQGGDNDDPKRNALKEKMGKYTLPAEFRKDNIHQKGALSMAREYKDNPDKRSVSFEFFIVQGTKYTAGEILGTEKSYNIKISPEHKAIYEKVGGCPHLDNEHTVFGQVIEGLDVIDSIAAVNVDQGDWPLKKMSIELQIIK